MIPSRPEPEVEVRPELPCARCGGELLMAVQVPVQTERADGQSVTGYRTATLCPHCDRSDPAPAVQGVLAFFVVRERITSETLREVAPVLREWLDHLIAHPPVYTDEELDADIRAWKRGDM